MTLSIDILQAEPHLASHQNDEAKRRRLRWRARRGLLENDLVLGRYFDRFEQSMSDADVAGLDEVLDLTDNDLLDLIFERPLKGEAPTLSANGARVLSQLRQV
jgi:antitoxin CptB